MKNKIFKIWVERLNDESPDYSFLQQDGFEDRLEKFQNDDFYFIGIVAYAEIGIPIDYYNGLGYKKTAYKMEKISSGGLWGIESDSEESYLKEVETEQLGELRGYLKSLNVSVRNFDNLIKS